ncbi:MAG: LLM class flavin-dependent oxidoreductase [Chloroflexi bacterium]|nr:LLM class flavin-dependent oxidoreductase [Chloroflexota bacterium]
MKFGVLQFFSWSRRIPLDQVYARAFERIDIMDQSGYDAVWLAEHHFNTYSVCPSVTIMGTHVAARTKNLRIGTAVTLAAFYHPLRLAEDLALLDILSGGRLNWGAGRGFDPTEFRAFDVRVEESSDRFRECVEIVEASWRHERVNHDGKYWQIRDIEVLPKPLQQPNPPVWLAATSPESIRKAAEKGYTILMDPHATHKEIAAKRVMYRQILEESGFSLAGRQIPIARLVAIGKTAAEAEEVARAGAQWTVGSYARPELTLSGQAAPADPIERYVSDVIIKGTPEQVIDQLQQLREELPLEYLLCAPLSHDTFVQFTEKVVPRLS